MPNYQIKSFLPADHQIYHLSRVYSPQKCVQSAVSVVKGDLSAVAGSRAILRPRQSLYETTGSGPGRFDPANGQPTHREERCSAVPEQSADVHPLSDSDRTCHARTVAGERCRRLSEADGLCAFHLRHRRESAVLDPLEVADWTSEVAVLRVIDAGFPDGAPDTGSDSDRRPVP